MKDPHLRRNCVWKDLAMKDTSVKEMCTERLVWEGHILRREHETSWEGWASLDKREVTQESPIGSLGKTEKWKCDILLTGWALDLNDNSILCLGCKGMTVPQLQLMLDTRVRSVSYIFLSVSPLAVGVCGFWSQHSLEPFTSSSFFNCNFVYSRSCL